MNDHIKSVSCPQCQQSVLWSPQSTFRPFCSERCRLIDLGIWANEGYNIPSDNQDTATQ